MPRSLAIAIADEFAYPISNGFQRQEVFSLSSPIVVFDLDGTLVDTAPDLVASLNHAVTQAGVEPVTYGDLTHLVGHGARAMIERTFAMRQKPLAEDVLEWQLKEFVDFYHGSMPGDSLPYPGLVDALDRLSGAGFKLAVCTNKPEKLATRLLERLGLIERFAAISGGDTFEVRKPDAAHLLRTVSNAGGLATRTVMVGDSLNDFLVARNAQVPSIAVPFGYSDVPVESLDPTVVISHFDELTPDLVSGLFSK